MPKIKPYTLQGSDKIVGYTFECPGCGLLHVIRTDHPAGNNWKWNNDLEKPTFAPSLLVQGTVPLTDAEAERIMAGEKIQPKPLVCHSFIREGRMDFLGDCTHALKGQSVELPEIKES